MNLLFQRLKHGRPSGQIVIVVVLMIAVIVVFVAAAINLGKISQIKLMVTLASEKATINLASLAGSSALFYVWKVLDGETEQETIDKDLAEVLKWIVLIVCTIFSIPSGGSSWAWGAWVLGLLAGLYTVDQTNKNYSAIQSRQQKQLAEMDNKTQFEQTTLFTALAATVSDPVQLTDTEDLDMDTVTNDTVNRFFVLQDKKLDQALADLRQGNLEQDIDIFADAWARYTAYLMYDHTIDDGTVRDDLTNNAVKSCAGPWCWGFLTYLGDIYEWGGGFKGDDPGDNVNTFKCPRQADKTFWKPAPEFGLRESDCPDRCLIQLLYEINNAYGANYLWDTFNLWRPAQQPCDITDSWGCAADKYYTNCDTPYWLGHIWHWKWRCLWNGGIQWNDVVDDLGESMMTFQNETQDLNLFSRRISNNGITSWVSVNCPGDYSFLYDNFATWFKFFDDGQGWGWYYVIPTWIEKLDYIEEVLRDFLYYNPPATPPSADLRKAAVAALGQIEEAKFETKRFYSYVAELVKNRTLEMPTSSTYSWQDNLGWHDVYVKLEHTTFPSVVFDDRGDLNDAYELAPEGDAVCDDRGTGWARVTVIRYDQDSDWFYFLSGKGRQLWRFLSRHPSVTDDYVDNRTLIGCSLTSDDGKAGFDCANVQETLKRGVKSVSCARWGWDVGQITFVPCSCYRNCNDPCPHDP